MSNVKSAKNKKFKKLRRTHIWPSILFLCLSMMSTVLVFLAFVAIMLANQTLERINSVYNYAINTASMVNLSNGSDEDILTMIKNSNQAPEAFFITDKDGNVMIGYGENSYSGKLFNDLISDSKIDENTNILLDSESGNNLIDKNGVLNLVTILKPDNLKAFEDPDLDSNTRLFEARYWVKTKLTDDYDAIIKCSAPLYFADFEKSIFIGSVAASVMMLPTVFFFINVIISIHNQRRVTKLLYTDRVTGGNSFIYFEHKAGHALRSRFGGSKQCAVADVTVMKYRSYCNYHGVSAGETLLENIYAQINNCLARDEVCAYSGKASFVLLLKYTDKATCENRLNSILHQLPDRLGLSSMTFHAGIYFAEPRPVGEPPVMQKNTDPNDCFSRASAARALLPDENISAVAVYDDKLLDEQLWEHKVEEKMEAALANEEFKVYIQPKYDPVTEKLAGAEALVRWINEEDGFIPPGRFIPIFEKNGFITKLDDYMLDHVAKLQTDWLAQGNNIVPISVNVSRAHFANPDLAQHICGIVDKYNAPHEMIEIELTESAFFDDKAALLSTVHKLRELKFEISMDDFGAGYSSLNSLKDLPLDVLKLDADFFRGEDSENRGEIVVSQAISLAKSLNMKIVAEGIEKKEQVDFLAKNGCDMIQGYYYAKPMPANEYEQRL